MSKSLVTNNLPKRPFGRVTWVGDIFAAKGQESFLLSSGVKLGEWNTRKGGWIGCRMSNEVKERLEVSRRNGNLKWSLSTVGR